MITNKTKMPTDVFKKRTGKNTEERVNIRTRKNVSSLLLKIPSFSAYMGL